MRPKFWKNMLDGLDARGRWSRANLPSAKIQRKELINLDKIQADKIESRSN